MSTQPLLPTHTPARLNARRLPPQGRDKGKGKAVDYGSSGEEDPHKGKRRAERRGAFLSYASDSDDQDPSEEEADQGRCITFRFTGAEDVGDDGDLDVWVDAGESVASVKDKIRTLRPGLSSHSLRFIHSGRLLTDGILLLPWLGSLETRLTRQAEGLGGVIRGLTADEGGEEDPLVPGGGGGGGKGHDLKGKGREKVWLHCVVGGVVKEQEQTQERETTEEAESAVPSRRGFDSLLDAGFTPTEIAAMRREFYLSRGEEVPDEFLAAEASSSGGAVRDVGYEEHVRALEEQWIEGDLNNETAQTVNEGLYSSILHGLLIGFLYPLIPWFFFRDLPSPNFFSPLEPLDAPAPIERAGGGGGRNDVHRGSSDPSLPPPPPTPTSTSAPPPQDGGDTAATSVFGLRGLPGGDWRTGVAFGQRTQMAILIGTVLNVGFAGLRFLA
ncbi:hypothetical protein QFC19_003732 [Naganishia cerealis]|uniref:Uncharacterized protein n=1 Tax=Naganishia cerealis TaxID=610337 RepID=A0ACC2W1G4_9TREE|nr:hypothetical protein QFC19_003732 [Naganishia cerealis]